MPYASKAQQAYMHIHHPEIAKKWDTETRKEGKSFPKKEHVGDKNMKSHKIHHSKPTETSAGASPGSDNSAMDASMKEKQMKGGGGGKTITQPEASNNEGALAMRHIQDSMTYEIIRSSQLILKIGLLASHSNSDLLKAMLQRVQTRKSLLLLKSYGRGSGNTWPRLSLKFSHNPASGLNIGLGIAY